jgi:hypothetical protein
MERDEVSLVPCKLCGELFTPTEYQVRHRCRWCKNCRRSKQKEWDLSRTTARGPRKRLWNYRVLNEQRKNRYANEPDFRVRILARSAARAAIRDGRLTRQPCEICGATNVEAHHDDYSKALAVRWLCQLHHHELHGQRFFSTQSVSTRKEAP